MLGPKMKRGGRGGTDPPAAGILPNFGQGATLAGGGGRKKRLAGARMIAREPAAQMVSESRKMVLGGEIAGGSN